MSDNNLTSNEKSRLVSMMDHKQATEYDEALYTLLTQASGPFPHEVDDRTRRAISKYVRGAWSHLKDQGERDGCSADEIAMGAMTEILFIGHESGRLMQRPLATRVNNPSQEAD